MPILVHCAIVAVIVLIVAYAIEHAPIDETRSRTRPRTWLEQYADRITRERNVDS